MIIHKRCKIIILPTNERSEELDQLFYDNGNLFLSHMRWTEKELTNPDRRKYQHLYILSDDEIKENDWCINRNLDTIYQIKAIVGNLENWIKIIATTDSSFKLYESETLAKASGFSLNTNDILLPSIPQSFIDKYVSEFNKGNKIEEVMVEYLLEEYEHDGKRYHHTDGRMCSKVNSDNTINISSIKDSWTREEVIKLCMKLSNDYKLYNAANSTQFYDWIENNL